MNDFCIYKKNCGLKYKKVEHIIPAGLGGTLTLPKGYVCDEVNEMFSGIEAKALRKTLLAGLRNYIGPGHRGKMIPSKKLNPHMNIFKLNPKYNVQIHPINITKMGFMLDKKTIFLPQIAICFNNSLKVEIIAFSRSKFVNDNNNIFSFVRTIRLIDAKNITLIKTDHEIGFNGCIIGCFYDRWYMFIRNIMYSREHILKIISDCYENNEIENTYIIGGDYDFSYTLNSANMDEHFSFVYVKTVFNVMAYILGQNKIMSSRYDKIREDILNNKTLHRLLNNDDVKIEEYIHKLAIREQHIILLKETNNMLFAYISFYGDLICKVTIGKEYDEELKNKIFVSDWKKRNDYLLEYDE